MVQMPAYPVWTKKSPNAVQKHCKLAVRAGWHGRQLLGAWALPCPILCSLKPLFGVEQMWGMAQ